jgi:hypothetical protein
MNLYKNFSFFILSIAIFAGIGLKLGILFCTEKFQLQFVFRCYWIIFARVKPFSLRKTFEFDRILDFFSSPPTKSKGTLSLHSVRPSVRHSGKSVFRTFFVGAFRYSFDIWYIALPYRDTDQVWVWFWFIKFSRSYGPMDFEKYHQFSVFRTFFLSCFQLFIWYLVHCFTIPRYRSISSLVLIHWSFTKLLRKISGILFKFGFDPLIFKFKALGLGKIVSVFL